jgi:small subunit ribosomal protein S29
MFALLVMTKRSLKNKARGAVVGALSLSDKTYGLSQELRHALGLQPWLRPSPYPKVAPEITAFTKGIQLVNVPERLNVNEAASLFEVWNKNKSFHTRKFMGYFQLNWR